MATKATKIPSTVEKKDADLTKTIGFKTVNNRFLLVSSTLDGVQSDNEELKKTIHELSETIKHLVAKLEQHEQRIESILND